MDYYVQQTSLFVLAMTTCLYSLFVWLMRHRNRGQKNEGERKEKSGKQIRFIEKHTKLQKVFSVKPEHASSLSCVDDGDDEWADRLRLNCKRNGAKAFYNIWCRIAAVGGKKNMECSTKHHGFNASKTIPSIKFTQLKIVYSLSRSTILTRRRCLEIPRFMRVYAIWWAIRMFDTRWCDKYRILLNISDSLCSFAIHRCDNTRQPSP